jgi:hypothetical protein
VLSADSAKQCRQVKRFAKKYGAAGELNPFRPATATTRSGEIKISL